MDGIRFAAARRLLVAITVCLALPVMSATLRAQDEGESVELKDPVAIAVDPDNGHAFIVQESKLVRWTEGGIDVLVEDLSATSIPLDSISRMTFRDRDRLTLLGERNGKPAFATWAGWRSGRIRLATPSAMRSVEAASTPRYTNGSNTCPASPKDGTLNGTSRNHTAPKPSCSASWTRSR